MDVDFKSKQYCGAAMSKIKTEQNIQQLKSPVLPRSAGLT